MSERPVARTPYNNTWLFIVSVLALSTAGISFSLRADVADDLKHTFLEKVDPQYPEVLAGKILGVAFLGFAITIAIGSSLLDYLGMRALLAISSLCFMAGTLGTIFVGRIASGPDTYRVLWLAMLVTGIGWALVETVINPLTAALYPNDKTHKLNVLHAWWPGGIIIGGLLGVAIAHLRLNWQMELTVVLLPALTFGLMSVVTRFPPTERVAAGLPAGTMFKEVFRPFFLIWFCSMFLTAASELAPGQWVNMALTRTVHMRGIWLLVYVSGMMFVMRHFAGAMVHKLSPVGLLWFSSLLASLGLVLLSMANSPVTGLLAATVWGTGVCYMWPTMLAAANERFPRGGALLMGLMGMAGMLSVAYVLPLMGGVHDRLIKAGSGEVEASQVSFRVVAVLPAVLLLVFGAIWLYDRSKGGYKPAKLTAAEELGAAQPGEL